MRTITLDPMFHYQVRKEGTFFILYQYPSECPGREEREGFRDSEARRVDSWAFQDEVRFVSLVSAGRISREISDEILCGDDFLYELALMTEE